MASLIDDSEEFADLTHRIEIFSFHAAIDSVWLLGATSCSHFRDGAKLSETPRSFRTRCFFREIFVCTTTGSELPLREDWLALWNHPAATGAHWKWNFSHDFGEDAVHTDFNVQVALRGCISRLSAEAGVKKVALETDDYDVNAEYVDGVMTGTSYNVCQWRTAVVHLRRGKAVGDGGRIYAELQNLSRLLRASTIAVVPRKKQ